MQKDLSGILFVEFPAFWLVKAVTWRMDEGEIGS